MLKSTKRQTESLSFCIMGILTQTLVQASVMIVFSTIVSAQAPRPNARGGRNTISVLPIANGSAVDVPILQPADPGTPIFEAKMIEPCSDEFRTIDGTCTNLRDRLWGSSSRPQLLPNGVSSAKIALDDLPSAREISNVICKQSKDVPSRRKLSELLTYFGQVRVVAILLVIILPGSYSLIL